MATDTIATLTFADAVAALAPLVGAGGISGIIIGVLAYLSAKREGPPLPHSAPFPDYETIHLQGPLARTSASLDECAALLRSVIAPLQRLTEDQQRALAMLERLHERLDPAALREHITNTSRQDKHAVINAIQPELGKTDVMIRDLENLLRGLHAENRPIFERISEVLVRLEERGRRLR